MADNKKYYYLKLKDNFYDSEQMIILQNMQDGYLYSDILMKLYLRSLKTDGKLIFNNIIPYTPEVLAQVVRHQVGTVKQALQIFKQLGLIEILDNGTIFMLDIQNFIGKSSTEADRIRQYRNEINEEKLIGCTNVQQMNNKNTPEIEIEKEINIEIKKENIIKEKNNKFKKPTIEEIEEYCKERKNNINAQQFYDYYESVGWKVGKNSMKDWKACIRTWENKEKQKQQPKLSARELRDIEFQKKLESGYFDDVM